MSKNLVIIALVLLFGLIYFIFKFFMVASPLKNVTLKIGEQEFQVEVAKDDLSRMRGLSGREHLAEDQGMLFMFDEAGNHGFWMKGMKFPLDIVWIRDNHIVGITENVPITKDIMPPVYYPPAPADRVLELNVGTIAAHGIQVGDKVMIK